MKKKKKLIKIVSIICLIIIIIELLIVVIDKISREKSIVHIDNLNDLEKVSDGYIGVGESDFYNSKYVNPLTYEYKDQVTGQTSNIIATQSKIVKYDNNMKVVWENTFSNKYDSNFYGVISVDDGYIAVGSYIKDYKQIDLKPRDALIVKYDLSGKMIWHNTYSVFSDTEFYKIIDDGNNNYVIIGQSIYENMEMGFQLIGGGIIVRINSDGEIISHNNYGGNKSGIFNDIVKVSDGYIVCGKDAVNYGMLVKFKNDFNREEEDIDAVSKKVVWARSYANTDNYGFTSMILLDDKIYLVGALNTSDEKNEKNQKVFKYQAGIVTYNKDGKYLGKYLFDEDEYYRFTSITTDNNYLYLTLLTNVDKFGNDAIRNSMLVKYDLSGKLISKEVYSDNNKNNIITKIIKNEDNYLVIGTTNDNCSIFYGCDYKSIIDIYNNNLKK